MLVINNVVLEGWTLLGITMLVSVKPLFRIGDPGCGPFWHPDPGSGMRKNPGSPFFCIRWRKARANSSDNKKDGLFDLFLLFHVFKCTVPFFDFTVCSIFWEWSENRQDGLFVFFSSKGFCINKLIICRLLPEGKLSVSNSHEQDLPGDRKTRQYWGISPYHYLWHIDIDIYSGRKQIDYMKKHRSCNKFCF